jgi:hypothetical protein
MVDNRNEITTMSFSFFLNFSPLSNFFFFLIRSVLHGLLNFLSSSYSPISIKHAPGPQWLHLAADERVYEAVRSYAAAFT